MKLHGYFRSSASYRVRIALNLKGLSAEHLSHHLRKGEQCQMQPDGADQRQAGDMIVRKDVSVGCHSSPAVG